MKASILALTATVLFGLTQLAHAETKAAVVECNATVGSVLIYSEGTVNLLHSGRGDYTVICNLQAEWKGVKPSTCAMWTSLLQAQKRAGKPAQFYYYTQGQFTSCANIPTYGDATPPVYIGAIE